MKQLMHCKVKSFFLASSTFIKKIIGLFKSCIWNFFLSSGRLSGAIRTIQPGSVYFSMVLQVRGVDYRGKSQIIKDRILLISLATSNETAS